MAEIQILGSAAAEGIPAIFCNCRVCREAWKNGGRDMRMRTAYRLNDEVRIDLGPDTMAQEHRFQLHSEKLKHLFMTHSHEDHLYLNLLEYRMPGYSEVAEDNILNVYGNPGVIQSLQRFFWGKPFSLFNGDYRKFRLNPVTLEHFQPIVLEDQDMEFYPLPADHQLGEPGEQPQIFVIRIGTSWCMIANDTGYFREDVWQYLEQKRFKLDCVIADCTEALLDCRRGHMSGKCVLECKERLEKIGCISGNTRFAVNHFSHDGHATHAELEAHFTPRGILVGYDGMKIRF